MKTYCILGNCQANALASTLQVCRTFKDTYRYIRVPPIHRITRAEHERFLTETLPSVDLFAYQPISDGFRGGGFGFSDALNALDGKTVVVSYPSVQFYGYHASARTLKELPDAVRDLTRELFGLAGSELFHFSQLMICFLKDVPVREAAGVFHEGLPGDADFVRRRAAQSMRQLRQSEDDFGITARLHDKIAGTYTRRQLFWSPRHPKGELLTDISLQMLDRIGIVPTDEERARMPQRDPLKLPRYPLQRFVGQALELEFDGLTSFASNRAELSFEDMIEAYYALYRLLGEPGVATHLSQAFPTLQSSKDMLQAMSS